MGDARVSRPLSLSLILLAAASGCGSQFTNETPPLPEGTVPVALQEVAAGFDFPVYLTAPANDPRLFVVEKSGAIRIIRSGAVLPTPFLDLSGAVSTGGEQGLLGLAFPQDYASSGRFAVHYTDLAGDTRVSTFRVSADPDLADAGSESVVLTADQPFPNHNGGQIQLGPDGMLYIALGDGGSADDPGGRGQSLDDLLGAILRIDLAAAPYAVPADNPFVATAGARPEIWSYGLRNPWRFSFDRLNGDLYVGDVGQSQWEEIDYAPASAGGGRGVNFGWRVMEGRHCFDAGSCDQTGLVLPVVEYGHGGGECSVTGGYVYRGTAIPALQGHYFYADFCQGWVRSLRMDAGAVGAEADWPTLRPGTAIPSFGEDSAGELYVLAADGRVLKIVPR
jgi:glucose/arabinose dehydrogenase